MDNAERDSLIFYRSFAKAIKRLPEAEQLKALWAIVDYGLDGTEPEEEGLYMVAYDMAKPQIDANIKRKNDGKKGGRPSKKTSGYENEENIKTSGYENGKPNVNVNVKEKENIKELCPELETSTPASPTFAQIPLNDGSLYNVTENDVDEFQQLYPGIDCRQEIRNMVGWSMGNPRNRKTKRGIRRFIHSWLSRSQNRAPTQHQDVKKPKTRFDNFESRENNYEAMIWDDIKNRRETSDNTQCGRGKKEN